MTLTVDHDKATRILWRAVTVAMLCWITTVCSAGVVAYKLGYASGLYEASEAME